MVEGTAVDFISSTIKAFERNEPELKNYVRIYGLKDFLTKLQIEDLLSRASGISKKHQLIISFILKTGIRIGEMCNLLLSDIDDARGIVHVTGHVASSLVTRWEPKTAASIRDIRCDKSWLENVRLALGRLEKKKDYAFSPDGNRKYHEVTILNMINKCAKESPSIGHPLNSNVLRRTYAYNALNENVPFSIVSNNIGHARLKITLSYLFDLNFMEREDSEKGNPIYKNPKDLMVIS